MSITSTVVAQNKKAATTAAIITAGNIANKQALKAVKPHLPMMMRGYADTAAGQVVIANLVSIAVKQYKPDNKMANALAEGMLVAAMTNVASEFNIEGMIDDLLSGVLGNKTGKKALEEAVDE